MSFRYLSVSGNHSVLIVEALVVAKTGKLKTHYSRYLGGISRNNEGSILSAEAMILDYQLNMEGSVSQSLIGYWSAYDAYHSELREALSNLVPNNNTEMYVTGGMKQEIFAPLKDDIPLMCGGFILVVVYLITSFSQFNAVEQRSGLAICGLLSCGLSILSMYSICQLCGVPFNVLCNLVLIIVVGIGVDDMFVILQTIKSIKAQQPTRYFVCPLLIRKGKRIHLLMNL